MEDYTRLYENKKQYNDILKALILGKLCFPSSSEKWTCFFEMGYLVASEYDSFCWVDKQRPNLTNNRVYPIYFAHTDYLDNTILTNP